MTAQTFTHAVVGMYDHGDTIHALFPNEGMAREYSRLQNDEVQADYTQVRELKLPLRVHNWDLAASDRSL